MPPILNAQGLSKTFGAAPLFQNVSSPLREGDRIGLIGPNGSGKSTLLQILVGRVPPDSGEIAVRKLARLSYVAQESQFAPGETVRCDHRAALDGGRRAARRTGRPRRRDAGPRGLRTTSTLDAAALSGGWRKRLAIAEALVQQPDILLLDEPTNHLDLAGIEWLEDLLQSAPFACVVVSHDRYFLENVATAMVELSRVYPDGFFASRGNYSTFSRRRRNFCRPRRSGRRRWKTACATRSNGCGADPRRAPRRPRRASTRRRS